MDKQIPLDSFLTITNDILRSEDLSTVEREAVCKFVDRVLMSRVGLYQGFRLVDGYDQADDTRRQYL